MRAGQANDPQCDFGRLVPWLLIAACLAVNGARIATVRNDRTRGESPFFSANDRSRWCTIRALVDHGTFAIDRVIDPTGQSIHWDTIDKVQHVGWDGQLHFYSSKPPLFPTLLAAKYWVIKQITGWNLRDHPLAVGRWILATTNLTALAVLLGCLACWLRRQQASAATHLLVMTTAGFGTFLTTFAITLNNHLPAAAAIMAALLCLDRIVRQPERSSVGDFVILGVSAAFAAANELPALGFWVAAGGLAAWCNLRRTATAFVAGTLLVAIPFFWINWLAHGEWSPAYSHRQDGPVLFTVEGDFRESLDAGETIPDPIIWAFQKSSAAEAFVSLREPYVTASRWMGQNVGLGRWVIRDRRGPNQWVLIQNDERTLAVHAWGNWYDYPGSYWTTTSGDNRSLVDRGERSRFVYLVHATVGHHGFWSLTPIFLLAVLGIGQWSLGRAPAPPVLAWLAIAMTVMVFAFYVSRETHDRNYGGMTSGLRWAFWLIPFWLGGLAFACQRYQHHRWWWPVAIALLAFSIWSATYSWSNPWTHPWPYLK